MQSGRRYGRPQKARRREWGRLQCLPVLVLVAFFGCWAFLFSLPTVEIGSVERASRTAAEGSSKRAALGGVYRDLDGVAQEGRISFSIYMEWYTLEGAKRSFAALKSALEDSSLRCDLSITTQMKQGESDASSEAWRDLNRFAQELEWSFGDLKVNVRYSTVDATTLLPFLWAAESDNRLALFVNEEVQVTAQDVLWVQQAARAYWAEINDSQALVGLYLQPAFDLASFPDDVAPPSGPFLVQDPCVAGCVFFPGPWRQFQGYHHHRKTIPDSEFPSPLGDPPRRQRWQRHLAEMMYARGMLALHPPLGGGGQVLQNSGRPPDIPPFSALPIFDGSLRPVLSPGRLLYNGIAWAMRTVLQSGDPARQFLARALFGYPGANQCLLEHWTVATSSSGDSKQRGQSDNWGVFKRRGSDEGEGGERFLFFSPQFGLSNQMLAYADMASLATVLNRTLALAPLRQKDGTFIDVESVLDVGKLFDLGSQGQTSREYQSDVQVGGKVRAIRHQDFMESVVRNRPLSSLIRFDWSNRFGGREKDDLWLTKNNLLGPKIVDLLLPTIAMYRYSMQLLLGGCLEHRVLALDIGFLVTAWRQEALGEDQSSEGRRYDAVRQQLHGWVHRPFREELVEQVSAAVRPLGPFTCLHLRRGDFAGYCAMIRDQRKIDPDGPYSIPFFSSFTYRNCYPRIGDVALLLNATSLVSPNHRLYIATNEPDRDLLALHFGDAFDWLDLEAIREETTGLPANLPAVLLDRLVCQHAEVLIGNRWSTFSRSIAQSGPKQAHYVGFGKLALLSRPEDDPNLQRLRSHLAAPRFDKWQSAAAREGLAQFDNLAALLDFRTPPPFRACTRQPSEGGPGREYWYSIGYFRSRLPRHSHDVTLVAYASAGQLPLLRRVLRSWSGVVSLGLCLGHADVSSQLAALKHLVRETEQAGRARLDVSLLTSIPLGRLPETTAWEQTFGSAHPHHFWKQGELSACPVWLLLDLALDAALTEVVGFVDPFVEPSRGLYSVWSQPRAYRRLQEQAVGEGNGVQPRWLAVPMEETDAEVKSNQVGRHYVLAARQHLPCLRHLAAADDDSASTLGRHLSEAGFTAKLLTSGHFSSF